MPYFFIEGDILTDDERVRQALSSAPSHDFSAFESLAVWLGMRDGRDSLETSLVPRWLDRLFGIMPRPRLRDPHLECIRRLTVALRIGPFWTIARETAAARREGVSEVQLEALRAHVRRPRRGR